MNINEHLFIKLMEECAEVQQRVSKLLQFGPDEREPEQERTNVWRLRSELNDLIAIVVMLQDRGLIPKTPGHDMAMHVTAKRQKIAKYLAYSQELGMVEVGDSSTKKEE